MARYSVKTKSNALSTVDNDFLDNIQGTSTEGE